MISFVIPTKNEEKVIGKTLQAISEYSGAHEVIVSDGNSSDRTVAIAKERGASVVPHLGTKRQTISEGRNAGAAAARGEWLVFLDSDAHVPDPNAFFAKAIAAFSADPSLVALTCSLRVLPELETAMDRIVFGVMDLIYVFLNNVVGFGGAGGEFQMVRRDAFEKIGGFNPALVAAEDNDLFQRLAKVGRTRLDRSLVAYHTGRRAHAIGWPRLLCQWFSNYVSIVFLRRSASAEWTEIR